MNVTSNTSANAKASNTTTSQFRVYHHNNACLGIAKMTGTNVRYKADPKAYAWFEERPQAWLSDFQAVVRKLCRHVGHTSSLSISTDEDSGITVERIPHQSPAKLI